MPSLEEAIRRANAQVRDRSLRDLDAVVRVREARQAMEREERRERAARDERNDRDER